MSITTDGGEEIPRTDICENCEREIVPELVKVDGKHEIINEARDAEEGFYPITAGEATVRFSCRCSHVDVEFGPGSASAWDMPDAWMWEDEIGGENDE